MTKRELITLLQEQPETLDEEIKVEGCQMCVHKLTGTIVQYKPEDSDVRVWWLEIVP